MDIGKGWAPFLSHKLKKKRKNAEGLQGGEGSRLRSCFQVVLWRALLAVSQMPAAAAPAPKELRALCQDLQVQRAGAAVSSGEITQQVVSRTRLLSAGQTLPGHWESPALPSSATPTLLSLLVQPRPPKPWLRGQTALQAAEGGV